MNDAVNELTSKLGTFSGLMISSGIIAFAFVILFQAPKSTFKLISGVLIAISAYFVFAL